MTQASQPTSAEEINLSLAQFSEECDRGLWIKPRELYQWLRGQGVKIAETGVYYLLNGKLQSIKVGGSAGHVWIKKLWVNDWLAHNDFVVMGQKVGRLE